MNVFALVGPSGCGKSSLVNQLKSQNMVTMSEDYIGSNTFNFSNRELLSKWNWINKWINGLFEHKDSTELLITDRSIIEIVPYANNGRLFIDVITETLKELERYEIYVKSIYLHVDLDTCFNRMQSRLIHEPARLNYGEADYEFTKRVYDFYEENRFLLWDHCVNADDCGLDQLSEIIMNIIKSYKKH